VLGKQAAHGLVGCGEREISNIELAHCRLLTGELKDAAGAACLPVRPVRKT
jgi:hypothetical protein